MSCAFLALWCTVCAAQVVEIPADDPELFERYAAFEEAFIAAGEGGMTGDARSAIKATEALYPEAMAIHTGAAVLVADRLARLYSVVGDKQKELEWGERALDLRLSDPSQSGGIVGAAMRVKSMHFRAGRLMEAARVLEKADHELITPSERHKLYFEIGMNLGHADAYEEAYRAYEQAEASLHEAGGTPRQHYEVLYWRAIHAMDLGGEPGPLLREWEVLYNDERFRDIPERPAHVGWVAVGFATRLGDWERAEELGRDVLAELARFDDEIGVERALELGFDQAYYETAQNVAVALQQVGRDMEALEVLESAYVAYPNGEGWRVQRVLDEIKELRQHLDLDPDAVPVPRAVRSEGSRDRSGVTRGDRERAGIDPARSRGVESSGGARSGEQSKSKTHRLRSSIPLVALLSIAAIIGIILLRLRRG